MGDRTAAPNFARKRLRNDGAGEAAEDPQALAEVMFPLARKSIEDNLANDTDGRYTAYVYVKMGAGQLGNESNVSILGGDPSVLEVRQSRLDPGLKVTVYHPSGDSRDLMRLDGKFTSLAPTQWVSYPTYYVSRNTITCSYPALDILCNVQRAREDTEKAKPPNLLHDAKVLADGAVELHSGATLKSLLDQRVFTVAAEISNQLTAEMMRTVLPVRITLDADKKLRSIEVNGEASGKPTGLSIQLGFERRGPASPSDFPAMPNPAEVTVIPDEQGRAQLWQRIHGS
ncbi:hypothetical protein GCM10029964_114660 [Kibdelosporangium lantanae]